MAGEYHITDFITEIKNQINKEVNEKSLQYGFDFQRGKPFPIVSKDLQQGDDVPHSAGYLWEQTRGANYSKKNMI
jgi:hypothetical protein